MLLHDLIPINPTIQRDRTGEHKKDRKLQIATSLGQKQDSRNPSESMNLALPRPFLKQKGPLPTGHCELLSLSSTGKIPLTVIAFGIKFLVTRSLEQCCSWLADHNFLCLGTDSDMKNCSIKIFIESYIRRYGMETFRENVSKLKS